MPVTKENPAPYAPASAIVGLIERHRDKRLPSPINAEVLGRAQITESLIPRTLQAMQVLDLIDEGGNPTPVFEGIRLAPQAEYQQRLQEWLTDAYADALQFIDPATADTASIHDAFRGYNPAGQRDRMVTLFTGLFRAAGIGGPDKPKPLPTARQVPSKPRTVHARTTGRVMTPPAPPPPSTGLRSDLPPVLVGLFASLPKEGDGWTSERREKFLQTLPAVLDFCFPIIEPHEQPEKLGP